MEWTGEPVDETYLRAVKLAPRMVAWNTALTAAWTYFTFGEFVVTFDFPELIALGLVLALSILAFLISEQRYSIFLRGSLRFLRIQILFRAVIGFGLLLLFAVLLGSPLPSPWVLTIMFGICSGILFYRRSLKERCFPGLNSFAPGQRIAMTAVTVLATLGCLVSAFSE
jgi:hypothetical protein